MTNQLHQFDKLHLYQERLKTFTHWPKSMAQTPKSLAEAGFFYLKVGDQTQCFQCRGGLKDWTPNDNPWEQHARWYPKCFYVQLKMGEGFIENIKKGGGSGGGSNEGAYVEMPQPPYTGAVVGTDDEMPKDGKLYCKICFNNEVQVALIPCGHAMSCVDCALSIKSCAVCRKDFSNIIRIYT